MDLQIFVLSEMHAFNCNLGLPRALSYVVSWIIFNVSFTHSLNVNLRLWTLGHRLESP